MHSKRNPLWRGPDIARTFPTPEHPLPVQGHKGHAHFWDRALSREARTGFASCSPLS
jgi:hypothetical protein